MLLVIPAVKLTVSVGASPSVTLPSQVIFPVACKFGCVPSVVGTYDVSVEPS